MNPFVPGVRSSAMLAAILLLSAGSACALPGSWDPARSEALAGWVWAAPLAFDLPGARLRMRRFRAPMAPVDAARRLTRAGESRFERLQFSGAVLFLSGVHEGRHWMAQLRPADEGDPGTIGVLSSLGPDERPTVGFDPEALVPAGARRVLRASSRLADGAGELASYLCPGSYPRVAAAVRRALWAQRWRPLAAPGKTSGSAQDVAVRLAGEWARSDGARLTVHLHPRGDTVALTFWHRLKDSS
ncbi:MAG: hypothetical protein WCY95_03750 [Castellaniella sp.]